MEDALSAAKPIVGQEPDKRWLSFHSTHPTRYITTVVA
jgi:hypothetical protein